MFIDAVWEWAAARLAALHRPVDGRGRATEEYRDCIWTAQQSSAGTIDEDEVARFSRLAGQWWDPRGPMAALHKFNPVRLGLYPRPRRRAFRPRSEAARQPRRPAHARYRLRRRHLVGAAGAAWRGGRRRRSVGAAISRWRSSTRRNRDFRSITATPAPRRWRQAGESFRRRARHGSGRARHRCRPVRRGRGRDGQAGRPSLRRDAQSHHEKLRAGDRRRRIYSALAAARHPSMGQVRHARTSSKSPSSKAACTSPAKPA